MVIDQIYMVFIVRWFWGGGTRWYCVYFKV